MHVQLERSIEAAVLCESMGLKVSSNILIVRTRCEEQKASHKKKWSILEILRPSSLPTPYCSSTNERVAHGLRGYVLHSPFEEHRPSSFYLYILCRMLCHVYQLDLTISGGKHATSSYSIII